MNKITVSQCKSSDYAEGWNDAIDAVNKNDGWISVNDRLPDVTDRYYIWPPNEFHDSCYTAEYYTTSGEWQVEYHGANDYEYAEPHVTHWMQIPAVSED